MADNRADTRIDMRTPLSRVKGLGASGHGATHWWVHRLTAVSNVPLIVAFVIILAAMPGRSYAQAVAIVSHPLVAILLVLFVASVVNHMRLGLEIVIDDYVHDKGWKIAALIANYFFAAVIATVCLFSILKISLGWVR